MSVTAVPVDRPEQMEVWIHGLLAVAWADGNFDVSERQVIGTLLEDQRISDLDLDNNSPHLIDQLTQAFANDLQLGEQFLRTAVMVAVADGTYSAREDQMIQQFSDALGFKADILQALRSTLPTETTPPQSSSNPVMASSIISSQPISGPQSHHGPSLEALRPVRDWLDGLEIHDPRLARFLCKLIPSQCPFERDINLFGYKTVHIPPLCKLNPLYEQLVGLRFRSLCYLADECGEDVTPYC